MVSKSGIILLDKPAGLTSGQAVQKVAQAMGLKKAGHTGTLDRFATGLLIIAAEEARKAIPAFMGLPKAYTGKIYLHGKSSKQDIVSAFKKFIGQIVQTPPRKSAVARKPRKREVFQFSPTKIMARVVDFEVRCESGVYIRKLAHDLGEVLGCGAHLGELRRTAVGELTVGEASGIRKPEPLPLEAVLERIGLPKVTVKPDSVRRIRHGEPVRAGDVMEADSRIKRNNLVGIFSGGQLIALGTAKTDCADFGRGVVVKTDRIFQPGF